MEQRLSLVTLGVSDLPRAVAFYERALGWKVAARLPGNAEKFGRKPRHCPNRSTTSGDNGLPSSVIGAIQRRPGNGNSAGLAFPAGKPRESIGVSLQTSA